MGHVVLRAELLEVCISWERLKGRIVYDLERKISLLEYPRIENPTAVNFKIGGAHKSFRFTGTAIGDWQLLNRFSHAARPSKFLLVPARKDDFFYRCLIGVYNRQFPFVEFEEDSAEVDEEFKKKRRTDPLVLCERYCAALNALSPLVHALPRS